MPKGGLTREQLAAAEQRDETIRDALRMDQESLDALRQLCIRPGRNAAAQIAAIRTRLEWTLSRPAHETRLSLDPSGPLTVRFDLSGSAPPATLDSTPPPPSLPPEPPLPRPPVIRRRAALVTLPASSTPPGVRAGADGTQPAASVHTENFAPSKVSPTCTDIDAPLTDKFWGK